MFVVGCNNSGTSVLDYLLGEHPGIDALKNEGQQIRVYLQEGNEEVYPSLYPNGHLLPMPSFVFNMRGEHVGRIWTERMDIFRHPVTPVKLLKEQLLGMRKSTGGEYVMEKSPPDAVRTPWLQDNFSDAWFIGIVRNGYAVAEGARRRRNIHLAKLRLNQCIARGYSDEGFLREVSIERTARHWNTVNKVLFTDSKDLEHFTYIKYEKLCSDPLETLQGIQDFLGLSHFNYEELIEKPIKTGRPESRRDINHAITEKPIENMNPKSIDNLRPEEISIVRKEAREMLDYFGYPKPDAPLFE